MIIFAVQHQYLNGGQSLGDLPWTLEHFVPTILFAVKRLKGEMLSSHWFVLYIT
jgi:hypothetical protein